MPYNIPSSIKNLTLVTAQFLFILVGVLSVCELALVQGVYILGSFNKNLLSRFAN